MNKVLGALTLLAGLAASSSVWAACATTIPVEDSSSAAHTMGSLSDAGGNCLFETGLLSSTGSVLDGVIGAATAPTRGLPVLGVYKSAAPTLTTGQSFALLLDASANLDVNVQASVLPTNAATALNQTNVIAALGSSSTDALGVQGVTGGLALPISVASLPLPSTASTAANQTSVISAAGSGATDAIGVQGISGGIAVATTVPTTGNNAGNNANFYNAALTLTASTASTSFIPLASGKYVYITSMSCFNSSATGSTLTVQNGTGGTTIWAGYVPATFGFTTTFPTPLGGSVSMTVSTAVFAQAGTSVSSILCNASGYYQ